MSEERDEMIRLNVEKDFSLLKEDKERLISLMLFIHDSPTIEIKTIEWNTKTDKSPIIYVTVITENTGEFSFREFVPRILAKFQSSISDMKFELTNQGEISKEVKICIELIKVSVFDYEIPNYTPKYKEESKFIEIVEKLIPSGKLPITWNQDKKKIDQLVSFIYVYYNKSLPMKISIIGKQGYHLIFDKCKTIEWNFIEFLLNSQPCNLKEIALDQSDISKRTLKIIWERENQPWPQRKFTSDNNNNKKRKRQQQ